MRAPTILEPEEIKKRRLMAELQAIKGITEQKRREYARKREQELKKKEEAANQQLIEKRKQNLKRLYKEEGLTKMIESKKRQRTG